MSSITVFGEWEELSEDEVRFTKESGLESEDSELESLTIGLDEDIGEVQCLVNNGGRFRMFRRDAGENPEQVIERVMERESEGKDIVEVLEDEGFTIDLE